MTSKMKRKMPSEKLQTEVTNDLTWQGAEVGQMLAARGHYAPGNQTGNL